MMNFLYTIVLGIVEGITEFLPVSSTFHIDISARLLGIESSAFLSSFIIAIQLGAIIAIIVLFWKKLIASKKLILFMAVGFIPVGVAGFLLYPIITGTLLGNHKLEIIALLIGGIVFLFFGARFKKGSQRDAQITDEQYEPTLRDFIILGCWQVVALFPGVSRSGAVLIGGLVHRIPIYQTMVISFFLAIPTMIVATGYDLTQTGATFSGQQWGLLISGMIVSGMVAYFVARFLLEFVKKPYALYVFGGYRILLALLLLLLMR